MWLGLLLGGSDLAFLLGVVPCRAVGGQVEAERHGEDASEHHCSEFHHLFHVEKNLEGWLMPTRALFGFRALFRLEEKDTQLSTPNKKRSPKPGDLFLKNILKY